MNLICINDQNKLELEENGTIYYCSVCNSSYPVVEGVIKILNEKHTFYEGDYTTNLSTIRYLPKKNTFLAKLPLWLIYSGYPWYVDKYVAEKSIVLELGCGGGVNYFGKNYKTIGIDFSHRSLKKLVGKYEYCIMADALKIPLENESVNAIVSSYFWEHIEPDLKPLMLKECRRVLKPGGRIIFLYDIESANPLIRYLRKKNENAYQEEFISKSYHWGFQSSEANINLFREFKFTILKNYILERTFIQSPSIYDKLSTVGGIPGYIFSLLSSIFSRPPFFYLNVLLIRMIDSSIGLLFPYKWGRLHLTVCEKK